MYLYGYVTSDITSCNKAKIKIKIRYVMTYEGLVESNVTDKTKSWIWLKDNKIHTWKSQSENLIWRIIISFEQINLYWMGGGG